MSDQLRERRGLILHALHANFPLRTMRAAIERAVMPFYVGEAAQFARDIEYLRAKGYLDVHQEHVGRSAVEAYSISPAGVDLVERTTADPGVFIQGA